MRAGEASLEGIAASKEFVDPATVAPLAGGRVRGTGSRGGRGRGSGKNAADAGAQSIEGQGQGQGQGKGKEEGCSNKQMNADTKS